MIHVNYIRIIIHRFFDKIKSKYANILKINIPLKYIKDE